MSTERRNGLPAVADGFVRRGAGVSPMFGGFFLAPGLLVTVIMTHGSKRYPVLRTVRMCLGSAGLVSSFLRSSDT